VCNPTWISERRRAAVDLADRFGDPSAMATQRRTMERPTLAFGAIARYVTRHAGATLALVILAGAGASTTLAAPAAVAAASKPWVYQSTDHGYHLTLPSDRWRQSAGKPSGSDAFFLHATPVMQASVMLVKHQQSADDLAKAAERARTLLEGSPQRRATAKIRNGTNAAGNRYYYFTALDPGAAGEQVFIGNSFTWNPRTHVLVAVLFEGLQKAQSEADRAAELAMFEKASDAICLSVE